MSKNIRKLNAEIDKNLKMIDEVLFQILILIIVGHYNTGTA